MPMPRNPVTPVYRPSHNRLPSAGNTFWYPLHGSGNPGLAGLPTASEVVQAGAASGSNWSGVQWGYTGPVDNGNTDQVCMRAIDDDVNNYLDAVLGLSAMAAGQQLIIAMELSFVDQISSNGALFCYGKGTTASYYCIYMTTGEIPAFVCRPRNASAAITGVQLTPVTGKTFVDMKNQGQFVCVIEFKPTSSSLIDINLLIGHKTVGNGSYTLAGTDIVRVDLSGTKPPGLDGQSASAFGGFAMGAQLGASTYTNYWGRGAGNTGRIGNVQGRRYTSYDGARPAAVLANLLARPGDIAESFLPA